MAEGNKKFEFRKIIFKKHVNRIWIYASSPTKKIVGTFTIKSIIKDKPEKLWERTCDYSGISENDFFAYFKDSISGYAIEIDEFELFKEPIDPESCFPNFFPPQSFMYFKSSDNDNKNI